MQHWCFGEDITTATLLWIVFSCCEAAAFGSWFIYITALVAK